jgi:putative inorganic carbon (HCO3(-)) transporter
VIRFEWLALLMMAPLLLFPTPVRSLALLGVPFLWTARKVSLGRFIDRTPLDWPILFLLLMVLVSLYATYSIEESLPKIAGMILGVAVFYALVCHTRQIRSWLLGLGLFVCAGSGVAALALVGSSLVDKFPPLTALSARLPSFNLNLAGAEEGFHPNEVAGTLLWVALPSLAVVYAAWGERRKLRESLGSLQGSLLIAVTGLLAAFICGVLVLTQSRGGLLAFAGTLLGTGVLVVASAWSSRSRGWRLAVVAVGVVLLALGVMLLVQAQQPAQLLFASATAGEGALSLNTLAGRVEVWSRAIYGIQDFPITGMGMNTFRRVVHVLYPLFTVSPETDIGHAHNEFLQAALDLGIPGLIAFLALNLGAFAMLASSWRQRPELPFSEPLSRALILGLGGGLAAHLIYGMTDAVALGAKPGVLWWWLLGLIASLYTQPERGSSGRQEV